MLKSLTGFLIPFQEPRSRKLGVPGRSQRPERRRGQDPGSSRQESRKFHPPRPGHDPVVPVPRFQLAGPFHMSGNSSSSGQAALRHSQLDTQ